MMDETAPALAPDNAAEPADELLLRFVQHRDVACPCCDYNVRNLVTPVCPECGEALRLTLGVAQFRIGWFLAALIPCAFSGIAAFFMFGEMLLMGFRVPWHYFACDAFGFLSGLFGVGLFVRRRRFMRLPMPVQRGWAWTIWFIHFAAFVAMLALEF